jgi:hypothetical protein
MGGCVTASHRRPELPVNGNRDRSIEIPVRRQGALKVQSDFAFDVDDREVGIIYRTAEELDSIPKSRDESALTDFPSITELAAALRKRD